MTMPPPDKASPRPATAAASSPEPGGFTRFLWFCAGADGSMLARCPVSDWVKYQGIGGIVLATTVLAFVSASYAFYTVFSPKTATALAQTIHVPTALASTVAGLLWALVIFNIDRFIVSSTGKGDGSERITLTEFFQSMPRLLMAGIIGVCISAPLEIRILKPEIDAQLELEQNEYLDELNRHAEKLIQTRREELQKKVDKSQAGLAERTDYFEKRRLEINAQRRQLELEAEGKTLKGIAGRGPAWRDKKETLDKLEAELARDQAAHEKKATLYQSDIDGWSRELAALAQDLARAKKSNLEQSRHLDGLMKRIHISHEIGGFVPWAILLLLLAVETGPIFFKMMLVTSTYDYLLENAKRLATAQAGVEVDSQVLLTETNEEVHVDRFHQVEARVLEEKRRAVSEAEVSEAVHKRFREVKSREIGEGDGYKKYVDEG
ncbi:MAG TPA: DUF4407 domain-containing protein [Polyangiaceae bacterium]